MVWITQYPHILMDAKEPCLTVHTVDFQGKRYLLVKKYVNLHSYCKLLTANYLQIHSKYMEIITEVGKQIKKI